MNAEKPAAATTYYMSGSMFVTPGQQTWDLADLKIEGGSWQDDTFSFLLDTIPSIDKNKVFYYISAAEAEEGGDPEYEGWWYKSGDSEGEKVESFPIPAGAAFMCELYNTDTKIMYAGEVMTGISGEISIDKVNGQVYRFVGNPSPIPVDLTDVKIDGGSWQDDSFSFLLPSIPSVDKDKVMYYISAAEAEEGGDPEYEGWWYKSGESEGNKVEKGEIVLQPGEGFMVEMYIDGSKIVFPAPKL